MLGAVTATDVTPRGVRKQRCTRGLVVGARDWVAPLCWCPLPQCEQQRELEQGNRAGTLAHIPNTMQKVPFLYCT